MKITDTMRLDWLDKRNNPFVQDGLFISQIEFTNKHVCKNIRIAIDSAMKEEKVSLLNNQKGWKP